MAQIPGGCVEPGPDIPGLAECQATGERRDGLRESPLAEIYPTETTIRVDQAEGLIDRLRQAEPVFAMDHRLTERPNLGQAPGQPGAREYRRKAHQTKALTDQVACESCDDLLEHLYRLTVLPTGIVHVAQEGLRDDLRAQIAEGLREGEGVLAGCDGAVIVARQPEIFGHVERDPAQPAVIVYGLGECFG